MDTFTNLPAPIKASFTKLYNTIFKTSIKGMKRPGGGAAGRKEDNFSLARNLDAGDQDDYTYDLSDDEDEKGKDEEVVAITEKKDKKAVANAK